MLFRHTHTRLIGTILVLTLVVWPSDQQPRQESEQPYLLVLEHSSPLDAHAVATNIGVTPEHIFEHSLRGFSALMSRAQFGRAESMKAIGAIYRDRPFRLAETETAASAGPTADGVGMPGLPGEEWNVIRSGGAASVNATVCVIDSGVDLKHPDLNVDAKASRSFIRSGPELGDPNDQNGHGTHVAGVIAARDNGNSIVGIASGATIVAIKVVDGNGNGFTSDVLAGIEYVASAKNSAGGPLCDVANLSIGAAGDPAVDKAVLRASLRVPFVVAAGNHGQHVNDFSPARVEGKHVTTVTAIAPGDRWPMFSNYGAGIVDYAAPGVRVHSTWKKGGYKTMSGTSIAAAHVTGMVLRGGPIPGGHVIDPRGDLYVIPVAPPASTPLIASSTRTGTE